MITRKIDKKASFTYISPLALITLSACKFGQNNDPPVGTPVVGHIIKGPLNNALVFLDLDGDKVLDDNEQFIRTDATGGFTINTTSTDYKIVALTDDSTVDTSSGAVLSGVTLTAPKGAAVVTPTTTLMEEGGLTAEEVAEVLQLPDGVDPLKFNPYGAGVDAAKALEVEKVSQQIMTAVSSFASAAEGAGASEAGAFTAALTSVVDVVKVKAAKLSDPTAATADKKIDFSNTTDLDLIKAKVADEAQKVATAEGSSGFDKTALANLVNATTTSIKNVNDQIKTVTDLTSDASKNVFSTMQVLAEQVKTAAVAEKASKGTGTASIEFTNPTKVNTAASNAAPKDVTLSNNAIMEGSKSLVIGSLNTTDADQANGVAFKYEIAKAKGTDHSLFSINNKGELVLNQTPDYSAQKYYTLFVTTTDSGGKKYAKTFKINVLKDNSKDDTSSNNELKPDTKGPVFTDFSIKTAKPSLGEKITIEFKATDDTHVGYFNASFSSVDDPNKKINIKAQNKTNTDKLTDHFDFSLNSNNFYELSVPLIIDGDLKGGKYKLDSFSASDAKTTKNPNINNESKYGSSVTSADNAKFFNDLSSTDLLITIPVLEANPGLPVINEQESNATLEKANSILPDKLVKGTVFPNGEDWFKFDLTASGTIVAQMDMGSRSADLKLYGPDKKEIINKEVVKSGMIHHTTSDLGEYYLLVTDGNINNSPYEVIVDIV